MIQIRTKEEQTKHNTMKKRIITVAAALIIATLPAVGQVFITDEAFDNRTEMPSEDIGVMVPSQNVLFDQFTPIGEGLALLTGLGLVYWVGKRKKKD